MPKKQTPRTRRVQGKKRKAENSQNLPHISPGGEAETIARKVTDFTRDLKAVKPSHHLVTEGEAVAQAYRQAASHKAGGHDDGKLQGCTQALESFYREHVENPEPALSPAHQKLLDDSGISPDVARKRGYRTVVQKTELHDLGFSPYQCQTPALLIPIYNHDGERRLYQLRPDIPRTDKKKGKFVKYETPGGASVIVDVPPSVSRRLLTSVTAPLFITEGVRKADSAVSKGACCVALLGVEQWRDTVFWNNVPVKGRKVYICFDSDVMEKPQVFAALKGLWEFLSDKHAKVSAVYLSPSPDGGKVGLDDFLATGKTMNDVIALASAELRKPDLPAKTYPYYEATPNGIFRVRLEGGQGKLEERRERLTNFTARIIKEIYLVSDSDQPRLFEMLEIETTFRDHTQKFCIKADDFEKMTWVMRHLGAGATILPGYRMREQVCYAIQELSRETLQTHTVYSHTGWCQLDGKHVYLHGAGAVGASNVETRLERLNRYSLPYPPADPDRKRKAVQIALTFLGLAPSNQTWPLLAAVVTAPLASINRFDSVLWVYGQTGTRKSSMAAVALSFFGEFDRTDPPANFSDTFAAFETKSYALKDALLLVDDLAPATTPKEKQRQEEVTARIIGAVGDRHGRGRMTATLEMRGNRFPRGVVLVTSEHAPPGSESRTARCFLIGFQPGSVNLGALTVAQNENGPFYREAMAAYLEWISPRYDRIKGTMPSLIRHEANSLHGFQGRIPETVAKLSQGASLFLEFAQEVGAISQTERDIYTQQCKAALLNAARATMESKENKTPFAIFKRYLTALFAQGKIYLLSKDNLNMPTTDATRWGWQSDGKGELTKRPGAEPSGWIDESRKELYLSPDAIMSALRKMASDLGEVFPVNDSKAMGEHLQSAGALLRTSDGKRTYRLRSPSEGDRLRVWCLSSSVLDDNEETTPSLQPDEISEVENEGIPF